MGPGGAPCSNPLSYANVTVIEVISHLCLKPLKQVVQLLAARPGHRGGRVCWLLVLRAAVRIVMTHALSSAVIAATDTV